MRRAIPIIIVGAILLILGALWALQGAGIVGGSSLMDNNPTFIYVGSFAALVGVVMIVFGGMSKSKAPAATPSAMPADP